MGTDRAWDNPETMLGVDDALARILAHLTPLPEVDLSLLAAQGLVAARDVTSRVDIPPYRNSAMDGYAVRSADTADAPVMLRVVGTVAAGSVSDRSISPGEAIRIMTGAPVPDGADAVVRFEETDERSRPANTDRDQITIERPIRVSENVREAGEDIRSGQTVVQAGQVVDPAIIGVLAAIGHATVAVHRRPRVAVLSTGDELLDAGSSLAPGQIRDSNGPMLASLVNQAGGEAVPLGIARDTAEGLHERLSRLDDIDLIITSGGVSVGDYDIVKVVLGSEGAIDIWQVRMKPGKPLAFGTLRDTPLLGLPGNPAAAFVSFYQFARPAIRTLLGHQRFGLPEEDATLTTSIENRGRRRHFVRAHARRSPHGVEVRPAGGHGSGQLTPITRANCFIVVPEARESIDAGEVVRIQWFGEPSG